MHGADRKRRPEWIVFTRGSKYPVSKSMEEIEVVGRQFVRLAGTSGPVLSLACLTLLSFVWAFWFSVRVLSFFSGRKDVKGILSEPD